MDEVIKFYENVDEELRFQRNSRRIEFLTTLRALDPWVKNSSSILELGAGSGAYSIYYATNGHEVTALDITPSNIDKINKKISEHKAINLNTMIGNATNLSEFHADSFNTVLCLGPYYHIIDDETRHQLLEESLRVLCTGGILAIAYINKYSVVPMLVKKLPEFIQEGTINKVVELGYLKGEDPESFWTDSHYTTPAEIEDFLQQYNVTIIDHLGTDGVSHTISDEVDELSEEQFDTYQNYHYKTCREPSILGISTHGLIICKKN